MFKKLVGILLLLTIISCSTTGNFTYTKVQQTEPYDGIESGDLNDSQKGDKLLVAILLPLSGKAEVVGNAILKSAQLSIFDNKLNNIVLMPYDTKGTSFGAVEAINLAIKDNIDIVVGPLFTQSTKAILDIAKLNNLMVLSFSDNQSLINEKYDNIYLMGLTPKQEINRMISYLNSYKNFYGFSAMFPNDIYGSVVSTLFKDAVFRKDSKIIKIDFYSKNDNNLENKLDTLLNMNTYRDEVYKKYEEDKILAKAQGINTEVEFKYTDEDKIFADALLVPDSGNNLARIGKFLNKYTGEHKPLLVGTSKWMNDPLYNNPDFDGTFFVAPNPDEYINFEKEYYKVYNNYPLRISSLAYDAIKATSEAYAKAGERYNLKFAIENYQGFTGINGRFRFLSNGLLERKLAIIKISNGKFEIVDYDDEQFLKY